MAYQRYPQYVQRRESPLAGLLSGIGQGVGQGIGDLVQRKKAQEQERKSIIAQVLMQMTPEMVATTEMQSWMSEQKIADNPAIQTMTGSGRQLAGKKPDEPFTMADLSAYLGEKKRLEGDQAAKRAMEQEFAKKLIARWFGEGVTKTPEQVAIELRRLQDKAKEQGLTPDDISYSKDGFSVNLQTDVERGDVGVKAQKDYFDRLQKNKGSYDTSFKAATTAMLNAEKDISLLLNPKIAWTGDGEPRVVDWDKLMRGVSEEAGEGGFFAQALGTLKKKVGIQAQSRSFEMMAPRQRAMARFKVYRDVFSDMNKDLLSKGLSSGMKKDEIYQLDIKKLGSFFGGSGAAEQPEPTANQQSLRGAGASPEAAPKISEAEIGEAIAELRGLSLTRNGKKLTDEEMRKLAVEYLMDKKK